jgi:hypothetical protein
MAITYQCCFCGNAIEPRVPDVGGLLYSTCINLDAAYQYEQQLYCHTTCLVERLHGSVSLYVLDLQGADDLLDEGPDPPSRTQVQSR